VLRRRIINGPDGRLDGIGEAAELQAGEGDNLIDEGWTDSSVSLERLMKPEEIAQKDVHRVTRLIGAKKVPTQNVPVVFESPVTDELLGFLYSCVSGTSIYMKQSFLVDRLGQFGRHGHVPGL